MKSSATRHTGFSAESSIGIAEGKKGEKRIEIVPAGEPEEPFDNWIDRLNDEHSKTAWIHRAKKVRVTYDVSIAEMKALEISIIELNLGKKWNWNEKRESFGQLEELGANYWENAKAARTRSVAVFDIEASSGGWWSAGSR